MSGMKGQKISLDAFLQTLPDSDAAEARAAAARMDEFERVARRVAEPDKRFLAGMGLAAVLFVIAAALLMSGGDFFDNARGTLGIIGVIVMAALLPALIVSYTVRMRERTRADRQCFELNQTYFMPHGGVYFPGEEEGGSWVFVPDHDSKAWRQPGQAEAIKARWYW